jgi:hypothetical protein
VYPSRRGYPRRRTPLELRFAALDERAPPSPEGRESSAGDARFDPLQFFDHPLRLADVPQGLLGLAPLRPGRIEQRRPCEPAPEALAVALMKRETQIGRAEPSIGLANGLAECGEKV